ncbi:MAG: hypothetical protein JSU63_08095, partial [Phycisphaerales bacterium]
VQELGAMPRRSAGMQFARYTISESAVAHVRLGGRAPQHSVDSARFLLIAVRASRRLPLAPSWRMRRQRGPLRQPMQPGKQQETSLAAVLSGTD